jgi:Zn-dependent M28 family amino/carboxypeptidase
MTPRIRWILLASASLAATVALLGATTARAPRPDDFAPEATSAMTSIRASALRAHVEFLADDLLEGRATGTRGYDLAARYVASQFAAAGLEPGGTRGWYQPIAFRKSELDHGASAITLIRDGKETRLEYGAGFTMSGDPLQEKGSFTAPLVFVGHGVTAPELGHDDYQGLDARGKVVVFLRGAPPKFSHNERAYYAWSYEKNRNAVAHGAIGTIALRTNDDERRAPWARSVRQSKLPRFDWLEKTGAPHHVFAQLRGAATLHRDAAAALFAGAAAPLDSVLARGETSRVKGFALPGRVRFESRTRHARVTSPNVIGLLRGSDPKLRHEYVVYTGHLDHLGITEPVDGDSINNGAIDNASGIAAMIEAARAFTRLPKPPKRSILFIATTAEEKSLLGADYYSENPTVPISSIVANVNLDMFVMIAPLADVVAYGAEHSSLGPITVDAARRNGFAVSPDPRPEEVVFIRSDQFPFVRKGVPAIFVTAGNRSRDRAVNGSKLAEEWIRQRYHAPGDDLDQKIDWDSGARFARTNFAIGWRVAQDAARPTWNPGDPFGTKFGRSRMARK